MWYWFKWYHPAALFLSRPFGSGWVELHLVWASTAPVCFISPPVMGKSLLHGVSPCQRYLSVAIIWHQEKVEGDTGCKVAPCGCTLKRGPGPLDRNPLISKGKSLNTSNTVITGLMLFDGFSVCQKGPQQTVEQPRISPPQLDDFWLWSHVYFFTNSKSQAYLAQWWRNKEDWAMLKHTHAHTVAFGNSEMGVTVIPQSILRPPPSCSYFLLAFLCAPQSGKAHTKKSKSTRFLTKNICNVLSTMLPSDIDTEILGLANGESYASSHRN